MEEIKLLLNENIKFVIICGIAYILDFISGFSKAMFLKDVQSSKIKKSFVKGTLYFCFIIIGCCLEIMFPYVSPVTGEITYYKLQGICIAIALTDFYSVYENAKGYADIPFVAKLLKKFKKENDEVNVDDNG